MLIWLFPSAELDPPIPCININAFYYILGSHDNPCMTVATLQDGGGYMTGSDSITGKIPLPPISHSNLVLKGNSIN